MKYLSKGTFGDINESMASCKLRLPLWELSNCFFIENGSKTLAFAPRDWGWNKGIQSPSKSALGGPQIKVRAGMPICYVEQKTTGKLSCILQKRTPRPRLSRQREENGKGLNQIPGTGKSNKKSTNNRKLKWNPANLISCINPWAWEWAEADFKWVLKRN